MVQNMRTNFILYVITIKCINYMQERLNFLVCYKDQGGSQPNF